MDREMYIHRFDGNINEAVEKSIATNEPRTDVHFFEEYGPRLMQCPVFPNMKEVVQTLAKEFRLIIVSSTVTDLILKYLKLHDLDHCFTEIMGNDVHTSKIKKIEAALDKYGIPPTECFFVTDTLGDIKEAHHVGIETIAVTWGYQPKENLELGKPLAAVDTPEALLKVIR